MVAGTQILISISYKYFINIVLETKHRLVHFGLTMVIYYAVQKPRQYQDIRYNSKILDNKYVIFSGTIYIA